MDFLTQSVTQAVPSPPHVVQDQPQQSISIGLASSISDQSSVVTDTTHGDGQLDVTATAFGQLRNVDGVEGEQRIESLSVKNGAWRTWGKVEARVLLWQDGTLRKGRKASEQPKEEWVVEGTLWVTASRHIIFIVDRSQSPRCVALDRPPASPTRRLSLFGGNAASRKSFSNPSGTAAPEKPTNEDIAPRAESPVAEQGEEGGGKGLKGLVKSVKKIFAKDEGEQAQPEGENRLVMARTRSGEMALKLERTRSTSEPVLGSPFPLIKGHPITAFYVADPAAVLTVRSFPARANTAPFWSPTPSAPLSSPTDLEDRPKPIGGTTFNADPNKLPPCVEIDIAPRTRKVRRTGGGDEGEQREVTVGFNFLETLLSREAEDFREHVSSFMSTSTEGQ